MTQLLHIDASVRCFDQNQNRHSSISKRIAHQFIDSWQKTRHIDEYTYRDVGVNPPGFITQEWIAAVFTADEDKSPEQKQLLALSDQLIQEVAQADVIVISSPMYNYGMPAQLKAWFDQVVRINKTFDFDLARGDFPLQPLLQGKTLIIITSSGEFGFEQGGIREAQSHLTPHLRTLSKYLGVEEIHEIASEYQEFNDERHIASLNNALATATTLAQQLAQQTQQVTELQAVAVSA